MDGERGVMGVFRNSKKKADREQEIAKQQEKLALLAQAVENIMAYSDKAFHMVDELEKEHTSFDKALTQVVEYLKQIRAGEEEQSARESELLVRMEKLTGGLKESEERHQRLLEAVNDRQEELIEIVEQNKHFTGPTRFLNQAARDMVQDMEHMGDGIDRMKEYSRQMGVLSLGAAIEAGRMGEAGRKFVSAAEEVRSFAGKYQEAAGEASGQVEKMKQRLEEAREQIGYLTGLLKENNINMGKATHSLKESAQMSGGESGAFRGTGAQPDGLREAGDNTLSVELRGIWEDMKEAAAGGNEAYFEQTMQYMEQAGESFMREQQLKEQIKEQLERVQLEAKKVR